MSKSKIMVVAAVAAALVFGLGGFLLGQRGGDGGGQEAGPPPAPAPAPTASPTPSSSGGRAVPVGEVTAGEGGSRSGPGGMPLGFEHTEDGAVAAATAYQAAVNDASFLSDKALRGQIIDAIVADPTEAKSLKDQYAESYQVEQTWEPQRGAYAVTSYSEDAARVLVWAPAVSPQYTDGELWSATELALVWDNTDWRIQPGTGALLGVTATSSAGHLQPPDGAVDPEQKYRILKQSPPQNGDATTGSETELLEVVQQASWWEYTNAE